MDAYIQITQPAKRNSFTVDGYIDNIGNTFSEYWGIPSLDKFKREMLIQKLVGTYCFSTYFENETMSLTPSRYFIICRSRLNRYLLCYDFLDDPVPRVGAMSDKNYGLRAGIIVPRLSENMFVIKDVLYQTPFVGTIQSAAQLESTSSRLVDNYISIKQITTDKRDLEARYLDRHNTFSRSDLLVYRCSKIDDKIKLNRINNIVDSFHGAF